MIPVPPKLFAMLMREAWAEMGLYLVDFDVGRPLLGSDLYRVDFSVGDRCVTKPRSTRTAAARFIDPMVDFDVGLPGTPPQSVDFNVGEPVFSLSIRNSRTWRQSNAY
jgi:hypothetical protein